ncbi:M48 family metallopeptidase [Deinococcus cellulosilyticus]|uniref:YgjP-like metallopeptidase domain-containing protein n=1 Tax=Deinococcus cellulosilyticus (strain DSM 18568 / NBRC 106333 / KACC 11606 / 5516J-15) TaxID=1223518 RepID=A0A511N646_DEIC1|nr:SprT family zinc-dependent metalloprotease [Deinococcus cellulosilyticus]GEM47927.1 hypothetical protein DC3_35620 [Deinococcus cellulosilyticus NBRC 106333 = KACC 11606]
MTRAIMLQGQRIPYVLKRSARKTIGLKVASGKLEVSVPKAVTVKLVEQILQEKQQWILQKVQETHGANWELQDGLSGFVAGQPVTFRIVERVGVVQQGTDLLISSVDPKAALKSFLIRKGPELLASRVQFWAEKIEVKPVKLRVTRAQRRWGSMNAKGVLALSVGTLLLEPELLDYVIVHELCHLHHLNHSAEYWACVERFLPDFESRHMRVKQQGGILGGLF